MKSNYKRLGDYIRQVDVRNKDKKETRLLGVSIDKKFIVSIANTIGTDMSVYKIVKRGQFAYGPVTSRNGDKVSIALLTEEECIISSSYTVFEIIDTKSLLPEYLNLWFKRSEFDRYARFHSHGSAREIFDWEEMCNVELPIPSIEEQQKIVDAYQTIEHRIALKKKINENLETIGKTYIQKKIEENGVKITVDNIITLFDNMRRPMTSQDRSEMKKLYPYYGAASLMDYVDDYIFDGIFGLLGEDGTVINKDGYPTMQYVWGKFWVNNHAHVFQGKNNYSTELAYLILKNTIVRDAVTGAVQLKINQENLRNLLIIVPAIYDISKCNKILKIIFTGIRYNFNEIEQLLKLSGILLKKLTYQ